MSVRTPSEQGLSSCQLLIVWLSVALSAVSHCVCARVAGQNIPSPSRTRASGFWWPIFLPSLSRTCVISISCWRPGLSTDNNAARLKAQVSVEDPQGHGSAVMCVANCHWQWYEQAFRGPLQLGPIVQLTHTAGSRPCDPSPDTSRRSVWQLLLLTHNPPLLNPSVILPEACVLSTCPLAKPLHCVGSCMVTTITSSAKRFTASRANVCACRCSVACRWQPPALSQGQLVMVPWSIGEKKLQGIAITGNAQ